MPAVYPLPEELLTNWAYPRAKAVDFLGEFLKGAYEAPHEAPEDVSKMLGLVGYPESPKEAMGMGAMSLMPGYIAANYRTPEAIQALRKVMAEEMRSRGPVPQVGQAGTLWTDQPIDQILRGSWYHGMSDVARKPSQFTPYARAAEEVPGFAQLSIGERAAIVKRYESELPLRYATERGFPLSHHDALSLSNRLGEPSGVSLTMLPTKARGFSADEYIHRVLPRYGGPPTERTVNLMTPEGRKMLNDAYDVIANRMLFEKTGPYFGKYFSPAESFVSAIPGRGTSTSDINKLLTSVYDMIEPKAAFNQALSQQLQSQGKRGLLYNPHRWNEYEMLMLDPKYVLPVDYRGVGEYVPRRVMTPPDMIKSTWNPDEILHSGSYGATPGTQKGLSQIQDMMQSNASRLGDIYSERPWTQRLSKENKDAILQMIDERYREQVGKQLYGGQ